MNPYPRDINDSSMKEIIMAIPVHLTCSLHALQIKPIEKEVFLGSKKRGGKKTCHSNSCEQAMVEELRQFPRPLLDPGLRDICKTQEREGVGRSTGTHLPSRRRAADCPAPGG
jgi:hypothetical protein